MKYLKGIKETWQSADTQDKLAITVCLALIISFLLVIIIVTFP